MEYPVRVDDIGNPMSQRWMKHRTLNKMQEGVSSKVPRRFKDSQAEVESDGISLKIFVSELRREPETTANFKKDPIWAWTGCL